MTLIRRLRRSVLVALLTTQFLACLPCEAATQNTNAWVDVIQNASPAIVVIEMENSLGSGFFVNSNGTVVTNHHVIAGAKEITVRLSSGEIYRRAYLLSQNESRDIAVLRVEASDVPILKLGNSDQSKVGEEVLLIGAPRGLDQTVSNGIVSGIRILDDGTKVIQTTAPASPGSSGGPLLDRLGNVIGILTFSVVAGQNLNFAIPINYAKGMLETLSLAPAVTPLAVLDSTKAKPPNPTSNDPSGIWQADSGSQYEIRFTGSTAQVKLVPGSNPKYRLYEVALQNQDDAKTYKGTGSFIAKMDSGKECKFETEWMFVLYTPERIIGGATGITADSKTCAIRERNRLPLDLKKKK